MKLVLTNSNLSLLCTIHSKDANGELDLYKNRCKRNAESLHEPLLHLLQCDALHIHEFRNRGYIFDDMKRINSFKMVRSKIPYRFILVQNLIYSRILKNINTS